MRTLFAKFLLWFWLGLALILGTEIALESSSLGQGLEIHPERTTGPLAFFAELGRETLFHHGRLGLDRLILRFAGRGDLTAFCIDSTGGSSTTGAPEGATRAGNAALTANAGILVETPGGFYAGYPVGRHQGNSLALVFHPHKPSRPWAGFIPIDLAERALVTLLLGGIGCWLLVRYITAPVKRLRLATQRLAGGDLSARAGRAAHRHDELEDLAHDFDRMAERIEALVGAQRRLLTDISHELRSPLARMNVALELLPVSGPQESARFFERIRLETGRLNQLIEDVLTLSRAEAGEPVPASERVDLGALVRGVGDDARFEASAMKRTVQFTAAPGVYAIGSPGLLRSALENVVRNAVRHTGEGTAVDIRVDRQPGENGDQAVIEVRDQGPGLPADQLERVFEPFYRFDDARTPGGVGLGLAIARRAVARHGGSIRATSAEGRGLIVTIRLPAAD